jgi:hypothetical protein
MKNLRSKLFYAGTSLLGLSSILTLMTLDIKPALWKDINKDGIKDAIVTREIIDENRKRYLQLSYINGEEIMNIGPYSISFSNEIKFNTSRVYPPSNLGTSLFERSEDEIELRYSNGISIIYPCREMKR